MQPTRSTTILLRVLLLAAVLGACSSPATQEYEITEVWIPMPDGVRLAADIYWPAGATESDSFPVLLEYLPYRKDESRSRNYPVYSYFLDHGYVVARVDIRGTGNSEGHTIPYEYSDIELDDGEVVIDWLSRQPWSTGNVGMFGISWGGFNSIQMAMRHPPASVLRRIMRYLSCKERGAEPSLGRIRPVVVPRL